MSDFVHKPNRWSLFKNWKRETEKHPAYTGDGKSVCPHCQKEFDVWINAWVNETKKGDKYFQGSFKPKEEAHSEGMGQAQKALTDLPDDDIPF